MNQNSTAAIQPNEITVGELVAKNYHAAGVFRTHGLDFCCGGDITLAKACKNKQINLEEVVSQLQEIPWGSVSSGENFNAWEPVYLIEHIVEHHHQFVRDKVNEITAYAAKVARVHGQRHPENIEIYNLFLELGADLIEHIETEEKRAFPLIQEISESRSSGSKPDLEQLEKLRNELDMMEEEHEDAGAMMAELKRLSNQYTAPPDACATYRILYQNLEGFEEDLHKHVHLENNILFKKAEKLI